MSLNAFNGINSLLGLAFENLVVNNYRDLLPLLNLKGTLVTSAAPYRRNGTAAGGGRQGCQIDLLIQTRRTVCVVEIKRRRELDTGIIHEVDKKVRAIAVPEGVSKRAALVYCGSLSPVVEADGYFDAVIPARRLLGI